MPRRFKPLKTRHAAPRPVAFAPVTATLKLLRELIALPSVNPAFTAPGHADSGEARVADFLASVAGCAGLDVELQKAAPGRFNLIARLAPKSKPRRRILLAPHMDTVPVASNEQFTPRLKSGKLFGRGACDTKGSVAAMLTALCEIAKSRSRPQETEIVFAGLVDEENAQLGSRALVRSSAFRRLGFTTHSPDRLKAGLQQNLAIVGEPTGLKVVTAHKGSLWLELETRGRAAHGATPQFGRNAVHSMAHVVDLLQTDYARGLLRRTHPLLGCATVSVGVICGGSQPNIVPDRCKISVDRRTLPGESLASVRREITRLLRSKNLRAAIGETKIAPCDPMETDARLPLVREFLRAAGQARPLGVHFFCDAAVLSAAGIPSVVFGPGDIAQAHTADEWISVVQLERAKNLLVHFLKSQP